jgi:hypothetical protein
MVECFADPCQVAPSCGDGECVANYCGGCNAEFYDESGYAVCQAPDSECTDDADCSSDSWCREVQPTGAEAALHRECVPFAGEGETCDGFTPAWLYERCAPGLFCDVPDDLVDASGICRLE